MTKLYSSGSTLVYSTFLGGTGQDGFPKIILDSGGAAYLSGYTSSSNFPTQNAYQGNNQGGADAFFAKISASGTVLDISSFYGGGSTDYAQGIGLDSTPSIYIAGFSYSNDLPLLDPIQGVRAGNAEALTR